TNEQLRMDYIWKHRYLRLLMAPKSRRQLHAANAAQKRWSPERGSSSDEDIYSMDISTDDERNLNYSNLKERINVSDIGNIYELCGKRGDSFYDIYPELEEEARAFAVIECNKKAASFTAYELAQFIDNRYYEINDIQKNDLKLVRSVESCRLDLRRWGAHFDINLNRPYFEGHERSDVREHREQFVRQFLTNEDSYYTVNSDEDPSWNKQKSSRPAILICHDESTFRSGDVCRKR
ncbi:unnamed protein product, partial [Rotaria socialis]